MGGLLGFMAGVYGLYVDEDAPAGQGLVEYALLVAFVALACLVAVMYLRDELGGVFSRVAAALDAASAGGAAPPEGAGVAPAGHAGGGGATPTCPPTSWGHGCR